MRRFARLYREMDESNRTSDKVAAVERYFRELRDAGLDEDGAWALFFLTGRRLKRVVNWRMLRAAALRATGLPEWMLGECYEAVGDVSEMLALLVPEGREVTESRVHGVTESAAGGTGKPLHEVVRDWMIPMTRMGEEESARHLERIWAEMDAWQRLTFHKIISGTFRVGVQSRLVVRALAQAVPPGVDAEEMAHRVMGDWEPTAAKFRAVMSPEADADAPGEPGAGKGGRPYPFCLANQLAGPVESLGDVREWWVEPKWDGIRAQVIRRDGIGGAGVLVWSRGEENVTGQFPEVAAAAAGLPPGTVLDGEVVAYVGSGASGRVLPFAELQKRLNRKGVQTGLFDLDRVVFLAFDALEIDGRDVRAEPLAERKRMVEETVRRAGAAAEGAILVAPRIDAASWADAAAFRDRAAKERTSEGVMLKHLRSAYHVGRIRGAGAGEGGGWWKWKVDPFAVDAVLIAAQMGHGKRAGLYTDYTFGVWSDGEGGEGGEGGRELVPFAKAYSGLTEEEIREVDSFVRRNTTARMGPVRAVKPALVFEIGFEGIRESTRHKSGVAVRFPRMLRWRKDKKPGDADTLELVRGLLKVAEGKGADGEVGR